MNRRERRAAAKQATVLRPMSAVNYPPPAVAEDAYAAAVSSCQRQDFALAESLCRLALRRNPRHLRALVLLGEIAHQGGRNKLAVRLLREALDLDATDVTAHDIIAVVYQKLGRVDDAVEHFARAIALGLGDAERLIKQSAAVSLALKRLANAWPRQLGLAELLGPQGPSLLGREPMLLALLQVRVVHDLELERLLTVLRRDLLQQAADETGFADDGDALTFFCALARQCFLNDYVFALRDGEREQLRRVQDRLAGALEAGKDIAPRDLIAAASYLPLHSLLDAAALLNRTWPDAAGPLLTEQIRNPLEEDADRVNIPALTQIYDTVSVQVQSQYEENPYPRWTIAPEVKPTTIAHFLRDRLGVAPTGWQDNRTDAEILIAGCGTGFHSIDTALRFPDARILAIDVSRASLAFACRESRALHLTNIGYGQADILELSAFDRRFDVIEAVGVLHHLADPMAGWRALLSLLRPNGLMFVGLYSALARQSLAAARTFIVERGYRPTPDDIRTCRQELIASGWVPQFRDFSSTSGCRDLLFNVMEHQFTIPQIKAFLDANHLTFLGFEQLPPGVREQFQQRFRGANSDRDLTAWHDFEQQHPLTFGNMYFFWIQKTDEAERSEVSPITRLSGSPI
jgi:2-polyprenyl-3-methyl-5-hydroxy-6-metoxy-1,4-benzoquinol methylase